MEAFADVFAKFEAGGTVFGCIGKKDFSTLRFLAPHGTLIQAFDYQVSPLDERIESHEDESRTLVALRDALLPKLLSGDLPVRGPRDG